MSDSKWEATLNSRILANYFKELCKDFLPPYREANIYTNRRKAEVNNGMIFFLTQIGILIEEEKIDAEVFKDEIKKIKDPSVIYVEVLWYLEFLNVMTIFEFINFHECNSNEEILQHVAQKIFENMLDFKVNTSRMRKEILLHYVKTILEFSKYACDNKTTFFFQILMGFIVTNLKQFYSSEENDNIERYLEMSHFGELFNHKELDCKLIKLFFQHLLMGLLEGPPCTIKSAFKKQEKLKDILKDKKICEFFTTLSRYCDLSFLVDSLKTILLDSSKGINWEHMLCFGRFLGMHYKDGWSSLKTLINCIIQIAFQNSDKKLLSYAFLFARQGCFEKTNNVFPSYLQWFSSTFSSDSKRPINTKIICNLFFNFLTDLLPYDSTYYMKVHINRVPWVPNNCQSILYDYIELVKVQLSDLNISTELGICENSTNKSTAVFDVENVLRHFERTNEILSTLFQASMFCKDNYQKKFLVELLSKFEGKKSVRHKFILKLHSLGKIPNSMFKVYKSLENKI